MRDSTTASGKGYFHSIIVTRADGTVERYDPVRGSMDDMDACKALADVRAELIRELPSRRETFYPGEK